MKEKDTEKLERIYVIKKKIKSFFEISEKIKIEEARIQKERQTLADKEAQKLEAERQKQEKDKKLEKKRLEKRSQ